MRDTPSRNASDSSEKGIDQGRDAAPDVVVGVARGGVVLDINPGAVDPAVGALFLPAGMRRGTGRQLFATLAEDDDAQGFVSTVLGWNPALRTRAEMAAIANAIGDDLAENRLWGSGGLHYFEMLRRS